MVLTKKDLKEIKDVVVEATEPYFTAIKGDFNNMEDNFREIKSTLGDIHTKLKRQKKVDEEKVILLEKRITRVEAMVV